MTRDDRNEIDGDGSAVEVAAMFEDALLEVRYLGAGEGFVIGERPGTFPAPAEALPGGAVPLVRATEDGHELVVTRAMSGEVTTDGRAVPLGELAAHGGRATDAGAIAWPICEGARARIVIGQASFFVSRVAAPRKRPVPIRIDWPKQAWTVACGLAALVILGLAASVPPDPHALAVDDLLHDRRLPVFLDLAQQIETEQASSVKGDRESGDAAGGRARGAPGKMGRPGAPKTPRLYAIAGTSHDVRLARQAAEQAARDAGILGVLRQGSHIGAIFSENDSALGNAAEDAMGGLVGTEVGDSDGVNGLGLYGTDTGGGGTHDTIGLTDLDTIGRSGLRPGGDWKRVGRLEPMRHRLAAIGPVPGPVRLVGSLDRELVRRVVRQHLAEVRFCYQRELERRADLGGRVVARFVISPTGQVVSSGIEQSTLGDGVVESCVAQAVRRWTFPAPVGGGIVVVSYPFVLRAAGQ